MLGSNNSNGDSSGITNQPTISSDSTLAAAAPSPRPQQPSSHDGGLVPSQTINQDNRTRSGSGSAMSANGNRNGTQQRQQQEQQQEQPQSKGGNKNNNNDDDKNKNRNKKGNSNNRNRSRNRNQQRQQEQRQQQKSSSNVVAGTVTSTTEVQDEDQRKPSTNKKKSNNNRRNRPPQQQRKNNNRQRQRRQRQRYPWRKDIPDEAVDPITLESLHTLPYPPFALYAEIPYQPIPVWPISEDDVVVDNNNDTSKSDTGALLEETEAQRQQRILQEQWGDQLMTSPSPPSAAASSSPPISGAVSEEDTTTTTMSTPSPSNSKQRHVHLYDGRALAYYMVSQLQFIDPLNRRDLVRDEIVNLDRYLRRHGFANLNVTEAYDAKGITISTAGAAGNTAAGRATILQQEAAILLNALFGGGGPSTTNLPNRPSSSSGAGGSRNMNNSLMQSYQAHEYRQEQQRLRQEQQRDHSRHPQSQEATSQSPDDWGVYGDERGILVIDDDLNPGLRGNQTARLRGEAAEFVPGTTASSTAPYTIWSSSRIAARFPRQSAEPRAVDFPALAPAAGAADAASTNKKKALLKSNTLAKIAVSVKKTDPEERQRMYMAHDAWRRRAIMSNLTFGVDPMVSQQQQQQENQAVQMTANSALAAAPPAEPTEAQLERNRAFALALNVKPSTIRQQQQQTTGGRSSSSGSLKSGWARPTTSGGGVETLLDEFGKELNPSSAAANYPDELIVEARDRLPLLSKLERRWKLFLEDDKAASLPLWPMDRPTRTFVHQYSDFWRLKTESFDPEPKRYIHCVKLLDTRAPSVLLSDATRQWKGPQQDHQRHELIDLMDLPRSSKGSSNDHYSQQTAGQATEAPSSSSLRWNALAKSDDDDKELLFMERPRLDLQKRTLPLELPPYQPPSDSNNSYFTSQERKLRQERMEEKARKEREQVEDQRRLLEAAFASDDDDDNNGGPTTTKRAMSDDDSEWTEEEEQYQGGSSDED